MATRLFLETGSINMSCVSVRTKIHSYKLTGYQRKITKMYAPQIYNKGVSVIFLT